MTGTNINLWLLYECTLLNLVLNTRYTIRMSRIFLSASGVKASLLTRGHMTLSMLMESSVCTRKSKYILYIISNISLLYTKVKACLVLIVIFRKSLKDLIRCMMYSISYTPLFFDNI